MFQALLGLVSHSSTQVHSFFSIALGVPPITVGLKAREITICHDLGILVRMKLLVVSCSQRKDFSKNNLQLYSCPKCSEITLVFPKNHSITKIGKYLQGHQVQSLSDHRVNKTMALIQVLA